MTVEIVGVMLTPSWHLRVRPRSIGWGACFFVQRRSSSSLVSAPEPVVLIVQIFAELLFYSLFVELLLAVPFLVMQVFVLMIGTGVIDAFDYIFPTLASASCWESFKV